MLWIDLYIQKKFLLLHYVIIGKILLASFTYILQLKYCRQVGVKGVWYLG